MELTTGIISPNLEQYVSRDDYMIGCLATPSDKTWFGLSNETRQLTQGVIDSGCHDGRRVFEYP